MIVITDYQIIEETIKIKSSFYFTVCSIMLSVLQCQSWVHTAHLVAKCKTVILQIPIMKFHTTVINIPKLKTHTKKTKVGYKERSFHHASLVIRPCSSDTSTTTTTRTTKTIKKCTGHYKLLSQVRTLNKVKELIAVCRIKSIFYTWIEKIVFHIKTEN